MATASSIRTVSSPWVERLVIDAVTSDSEAACSAAVAASIAQRDARGRGPAAVSAPKPEVQQ